MRFCGKIGILTNTRKIEVQLFSQKNVKKTEEKIQQNPQLCLILKLYPYTVSLKIILSIEPQFMPGTQGLKISQTPKIDM